MHIKTWTKIKKRILQNLNNLICRNKSKLLANRFPGVYQLDCTCNILTKLKKVITRAKNTNRTVSAGSWKARAQLNIAYKVNDSLIE